MNEILEQGERKRMAQELKNDPIEFPWYDLRARAMEKKEGESLKREYIEAVKGIGNAVFIVAIPLL